MPEENPIPSPPTKKRNERTEAKFFENAAKVIAEAVREGAEYKAPQVMAEVGNAQAKYDASLAQRIVNQAKDAALETSRNNRENLYKPLRSEVRSVIDYAKAAGASKNDIDALESIARQISGGRAGDGAVNSVSHQSYVTRADNYSRFVEQYAALGTTTTEDFYKADTHRAKAAAMRAANDDVIQKEADADTSGELLDNLCYLDADSLLNTCVAMKNYIKSKYKGGGAFKNISKTTFTIPSRLRKK